MSELIHTHDNRATIRWKLLTSASALALSVAVSAATVAKAEDADRPLIWIELGGQMDNVTGQGEIFAPAFLAANPNSSVIWNGVTPLQAQQPPKFSFGEEGSISFQPEGSDWVFSAAARIGRSSEFRHVQHQTNQLFSEPYLTNGGAALTAFTSAQRFADTQIHRSESHAILDFNVGKDVGLGLFGRDDSSTLSLGVRIAQFTSSETMDIRARPDLDRHLKYVGNGKIPEVYFHTYHATGQASRGFHGMGPSLSWTGSAPFAGNVRDGELTFDWGANAAILFGKQKTRATHHETERYYNGGFKYRQYVTIYQHPPAGHSNVRSVTVPNVGGSVGLSWRVEDFKASMGYRADFFFGAMDVGIDAQKSGTLGFRGPYASISVGLGD